MKKITGRFLARILFSFAVLAFLWLSVKGNDDIATVAFVVGVGITSFVFLVTKQIYDFVDDIKAYYYYRHWLKHQGVKI